MPSSAPEDWTDRIQDELRDHERERSASPAGPDVPQIERYDVRERLGEGATAVVYHAWDRKLSRPVALKRMRESAALSQLARERFQREARAAAGLAHPNVIATFDVGEDAGRPYLVMELVDGVSLDAVLEREPFDERTRIRLLEKTARGVAAAHRSGIVHRDLKPANVLVTGSQEPKVGDFGLAYLVDSTAELTRTGSILGTPLYMAPEQIEGRLGPISPRTDVYALGAILYRSMAGRPPHHGESIAELYGKIVRVDPVSPRTLNPGLTRAAETVILKAIEKEPTRRYADAGELAEDLSRLLAGKRTQARPQGVASRLRRRVRRSPGTFLLASGVLLSLLIAAVVFAKFRTERELAVKTLRATARISVESALELRRNGNNAGMRRFLPSLEEAHANAMDRTPELAEVDYLMGRMYRALMEDEKALEYQDRALRKEPGYPPALYDRAVLLSSKYGRKLREAFESAAAIDSGTAPSPERIERSQPELSQLRSRILEDGSALEHAIRSGSEQTEFARITEAHVRAARGILQYHQGRYSEARDSLEAAVRQDPLLEEAWESLARTAQAQAGQTDSSEEKEQRWAEAETWYTQALSHDRGYVPHLIGRSDVRIERALSRLERREDPRPEYDAAQKDLTQAIALWEGSAEAWRRRGVVHTLRGIYQMTHAEDPRPEYVRAEEDFQRAQSIAPRIPDIWLWRGYLRIHRGVYWMRLDKNPSEVYAKAERDLEEALRLDPGYVAARRYLAYLWSKRAYYHVQTGASPLPEYAQAEKHLTEVLRLDENSTAARKARADVRSRRALEMIKEGKDPLADFSGAERDLTEALDRSPTDAKAFASRGELRYQRALFMHTQSRTIAARQDFIQAAEDFLEAARIDPGLRPGIENHLQDAQKRTSR